MGFDGPYGFRCLGRLRWLVSSDEPSGVRAFDLGDVYALDLGGICASNLGGICASDLGSICTSNLGGVCASNLDFPSELTNNYF